VVSEQDELPSSVGFDFRARLDGGRMYSGHLEAKVKVKKLTTGRLVNGSSCDGIDMVIKKLDLEPKVYAMMRDFLEISLRSFAVLPGGKNYARNRVVRSSHVKMDPAGRHSS
ncbi:hypothetical protein Tco_1437770, partial [Tanacetum coccineum]